MGNVTLNITASVSRIRHRSRSTLLHATSGASYDDAQQNDISLELGEESVVTAQNILYGYIEDDLTVKMEFIEDDETEMAVVMRTMRGFIVLPGKCRYTLTNPVDNTRSEPISVSLVTA